MQGARVSKTWQYFSSYSRRHRTAEYRQVYGRTRSCRQGTYPSGFARCFSANQWLENKARVPHRDEIGKFICITLPPASSACPPHRSRAHREHKVILPKTSPCPPSRKARTWAAATKPALWFSLCESAHDEVTLQPPGPARCYRAPPARPPRPARTALRRAALPPRRRRAEPDGPSTSPPRGGERKEGQPRRLLTLRLAGAGPLPCGGAARSSSAPSSSPSHPGRRRRLLLLLLPPPPRTAPRGRPEAVSGGELLP